MSANQMDYFEQKPDLDLKQFFEAKGMKLDGAVPVESGAAPPPKDTAWCATEEDTEEEAQR
jgi:hypothetical protein